MRTLEIIFWVLMGVTFYAYIGYGIVLWMLVKIKQAFVKETVFPTTELPEVTLLIAAYNERNCIEEKVKNSLALDYPADKLKVVFVTDGSTDGTATFLEKWKNIQVFHRDGRMGKMAAINRIMPLVQSPIVCFSDANALLNKEAIREIVKHFENPKVGVVAGEKRIANLSGRTSEVGEGIYWKYESFLKKLDAKLYSAVGAAGELFAVRTKLFEEVATDTLLDDFVLSLQICAKGYITAYEPNAYALETASVDTGEELKRKIRICAGGYQSIFRLTNLLNPFNYPWLTFQYISHRVLRWAIVPWALVIMWVINGILASENHFYQGLFAAQCIFYVTAWLGYFFEKNGKKINYFTFPSIFL